MNRFGPSRACKCGKELDGGELCAECDEEEIAFQEMIQEDMREEDYEKG